jgi:hypothetical protein
MRTRASGYPSWPGVTDSTKGRIYWRRPTAILRFSLATLRRTLHSDMQLTEESGTAPLLRMNNLATTFLGEGFSGLGRPFTLKHQSPLWVSPFLVASVRLYSLSVAV